MWVGTWLGFVKILTNVTKGRVTIRGRGDNRENKRKKKKKEEEEELKTCGWQDIIGD